MTSRTRNLILAVSLVAGLGTGRALPAQPPELGDIRFPNSGSPKAQASFLRGVAWLHSFGYEDAIEAFREAQAADPSFALAYWGEAMCYHQPVWFSEDVEAGRRALDRLAPTAEGRAAKAPTARERTYLQAVDLLFTNRPAAEREAAYSHAMEALADANPDDDEAACFYALSLLDIVPRGQRDAALEQKAGSIAERVFARNPMHPGAAHLIIHAYDDREHAARALPAARAYARIASAASHALHMPSHIFMQLGLWDDAVSSNEASYAVSVERVQRKHLPQTDRDFHSLGWLQYEYLQQGRFQQARALEADIEAALGDTRRPTLVHPAEHGEIGVGGDPASLKNELANLRSRYVIEGRRWDRMQGLGTFDNVDELFALGMSAAKLGDVNRAEAAWHEFVKLSQAEPDPERKLLASVMEREMGALYSLAAGKPRDAENMMTEATSLEARMPLPIGRPYPVKLSNELFGEMLLEIGEPARAAKQFEMSLKRVANRSLSVLGLARAKAKMGDEAGARAQFVRLLDNYHVADRDLPELREAREGTGGSGVSSASRDARVAEAENRPVPSTGQESSRDFKKANGWLVLRMVAIVSIVIAVAAIVWWKSRTLNRRLSRPETRKNRQT